MQCFVLEIRDRCPLFINVLVNRVSCWWSNPEAEKPLCCISYFSALVCLLIAFANKCSPCCHLAPSQQPPPKGQVQSSSAIHLSWSPPDSPRAHWLTYRLLRDGSEIYTTEDQYPYGECKDSMMERATIHWLCSLMLGINVVSSV